MKRSYDMAGTKTVTLRGHGFSMLALILLILAFAFGALLRLDQISSQLLIDDEWHAIHKLLSAGGIKDIVLSFGYADHSIPLTLLYWYESAWFGLSELGMRWPMIAAGLITLAIFPLYVLRQLGRREAVVFAWLLALSPMLVNYSRTSRPYAMTVLLSYLAYWAFYEFLRRPNYARYGLISGCCMVLAAWLHPIILFFLVAPFLVEGISALRGNPDQLGQRIRRLLLLGLPIAACILALLLPTLLSDPAALTNKLGKHGIEMDSWLGAWHLWMGTSSQVIALLFLVLALFGWRKVWRVGQPVHAAVAGLVMTLAIIVATKPEWIQLPIVLARYLLPFLPLLLLLVAVGSVSLVDGVRQRLPKIGNTVTVAILSIPVLAQAAYSPLIQLLHYPNNETLHSFFQFDFRPGKNPFAKWMDEIPVSPFWSMLSSRPIGSIRIAVAPWQFESYHWAGPRWEVLSHQHVIPGLLTGLCVDSRLGEYSEDSGIKLKNMVHLADQRSMDDKGIGMIVFLKPFEQTIAGTHDVIGKHLVHCQITLAKRYGAPVYQDASIQVYGTSIFNPAWLRSPPFSVAR